MWPQLLQAGHRLDEVHRTFGTYFWDVGAEVTYHLSGRKLKAADPSAEPSSASASASASAAPFSLTTTTTTTNTPAVVLPSGPAALSGEARCTGTYTAAAAERAAVVAGLAMIVKEPKPEGSGPKFKGRCFICGLKGHSKVLCPERSQAELVPPETHAAGVIAGC